MYHTHHLTYKRDSVSKIIFRSDTQPICQVSSHAHDVGEEEICVRGKALSAKGQRAKGARNTGFLLLGKGGRVTVACCVTRRFTSLIGSKTAGSQTPDDLTP